MRRYLIEKGWDLKHVRHAAVFAAGWPKVAASSLKLHKASLPASGSQRLLNSKVLSGSRMVSSDSFILQHVRCAGLAQHAIVHGSHEGLQGRVSHNSLEVHESEMMLVNEQKQVSEQLKKSKETRTEEK